MVQTDSGRRIFSIKSGITACLTRSLYAAYALVGRNTKAWEVTVTGLPTLEEGKTYAAKFQWAEASRHREDEFVDRVVRESRGRYEDEVDGHLPRIYLAAQYDASNTHHIRDALSIPHRGEGRVLRVYVMELLQPLLSLPAPDIFRAIWDVINCEYHTSATKYSARGSSLSPGHQACWDLGVEHHDISFSNIMVRTSAGWDKSQTGTQLGVLNDFDLAVLTDDTAPTGLQRTGTRPFMALSFLRANGRGTPSRYIEDLESFLWVYYWICFKHDTTATDTRLRRTVFHKWVGSYEDAYNSKYTLLDDEAFDKETRKPAMLHAPAWNRIGLHWTAAQRQINKMHQGTTKSKDVLKTLRDHLLSSSHLKAGDLEVRKAAVPWRNGTTQVLVTDT